MGLPKATGLFKDLFDSMCKSNKKKSNTKDYGSAANMTEEEKKISFMNRFFVFQKKRNVETNLVQKNMKEELVDVIVDTNDIEMTKIKDTVIINRDIIPTNNPTINPAVIRVKRRHNKNTDKIV
jgi:hypothetical protein